MRILEKKFALGLFILLFVGVSSSLAVGGGRRSLAVLNSSQQEILNDLPDDDQREFKVMRDKFCEGRQFKDFAGSFRILKDFIERKTEWKHRKALLVGYFPTLEGVFVVNQGYLKNILSICKSTLNRQFANMGINKNLYRIGEFNCSRLSLVIPTLDTRQWVVRIPKRLELVPRMITSVAVRAWWSTNSPGQDTTKKDEEDRLEDLQITLDYEANLFGNLNIANDYRDIQSEDTSNAASINPEEQKSTVNYRPLDAPSVEPLPIY